VKVKKLDPKNGGQITGTEDEPIPPVFAVTINESPGVTGTFVNVILLNPITTFLIWLKNVPELDGLDTVKPRDVAIPFRG
jgi:hypothetical protein